MLTGIAGACMAAVAEDDRADAKGAASRPADTTDSGVQGAVAVEVTVKRQLACTQKLHRRSYHRGPWARAQTFFHFF